MNNPKITVIVKTREVTGHLDEFIDNLYAQTLEDWECQIIDGTPNIHSQKHVMRDNKRMFCQMMYEEFNEEYQLFAEALAKQIQKQYGENHPIIIANDVDIWDDKVLEDVYEEFKNGREE